VGEAVERGVVLARKHAVAGEERANLGEVVGDELVVPVEALVAVGGERTGEVHGGS